MRAKRMKNMERTEGAEPSFNEIIDVSDDMRRRRGRRRKTVAMRVSAALLIVISICIGGFPAMLQYRSAHSESVIRTGRGQCHSGHGDGLLRR